MEYIKINVRILGRYPKMIIDESDPHFKAFKAWADNEDRNGGRQICQMCDAPDSKQEAPAKVTAPVVPQASKVDKEKGKARK